MPPSSPNRAGSKRKREPSPEDKKVPVAVYLDAVDAAASAPSQNKRPRRAAALRAEAKMQVKDEEDESIPLSPNSAPTTIKPEPGPKLDPDVKVEAKPEVLPPETRVSKVSAQRSGRMPTAKRTSSPAAGPSTAIPSRARQETDEVRDAALTPSEGPSEAKAEGEDDGPLKEAKRVREEKWKQWCEVHKWIRQDDPRHREKAGDRVVHRSDAKAYYRFVDYEIDTVPYVAFDNPHNVGSFGRSYHNANLRTLVSRKMAYLAGLDERPDPEKEAEFLQAGWKLFEAFVKELEENMKKKGKTRKPLRLRMVVRRPLFPY